MSAPTTPSSGLFMNQVNPSPGFWDDLQALSPSGYTAASSRSLALPCSNNGIRREPPRSTLRVGVGSHHRTQQVQHHAPGLFMGAVSHSSNEVNHAICRIDNEINDCVNRIAVRKIAHAILLLPPPPTAVPADPTRSAFLPQRILPNRKSTIMSLSGPTISSAAFVSPFYQA